MELFQDHVHWRDWILIVLHHPELLYVSLSEPVINLSLTAIPDINQLTNYSPHYRYKNSNKSLCLTKHYAMKAYWGSGCIAPRILDLGSGWR
jgi:hypothetical protein